MVQSWQGVDGWRIAKQKLADLLGNIETKQEEVKSATDVCDDFFQKQKDGARRQRTNERYQLHKYAKKFMAGGAVLSVAKLGSEVLHFAELPLAQCPGCPGEFYIMRKGPVADAMKGNFAEPFVFTMDSAPDEYKRIFETFGSLLSEREAAIAAKRAEAENKALRGLRPSSSQLCGWLPFGVVL